MRGLYFLFLFGIIIGPSDSNGSQSPQKRDVWFESPRTGVRCYCEKTQNQEESKRNKYGSRKKADSQKYEYNQKKYDNRNLNKKEYLDNKNLLERKKDLNQKQQEYFYDKYGNKIYQDERSTRSYNNPRHFYENRRDFYEKKRRWDRDAQKQEEEDSIEKKLKIQGKEALSKAADQLMSSITGALTGGTK